MMRENQLKFLLCCFLRACLSLENISDEMGSDNPEQDGKSRTEAGHKEDKTESTQK